MTEEEKGGHTPVKKPKAVLAGRRDLETEQLMTPPRNSEAGKAI
jgi:hypothetical protein